MNRILLFVTCVFCISVSRIYAQENYNWNLQYGTKSTLLGGAVIGSVSDLSATYYNPGAIALYEEAVFILSAQVYQVDIYKIKNGASEGADLDFSYITPTPSFVAIGFDFGFLGEDKLAFSLLTRQNSRLDFDIRIIDSLEVIRSSPGKESFAGGVRIEKKFTDVWAGITYSSKLNEVFGLGLTGYLSYSSNQAATETILQALLSGGEIAAFTNINDYSYSNARTLLKAGLGVNLSPLTLGLTVTTPSLNLFGSGSVGSNLFLSGVDSTVFQSNFQDDVTSEYKSSWAIGFGAAYTINDFKITFSTEWFDAIKKFYVLDTEPFKEQSSGDVIEDDLTHETKSIINYGFGVDYYLHEKFIISTSFVTDFSSRDPNTTTNLTRSTNWNIYHISLGSTFQIEKSDVTIGIAYSFGSDTFKNDINISPDSDNSPEIVRDTEIVFNRIKLLLGFVL